MPPGAVLDLDDPDVGIELDLARQIGLGVGLRRRLLLSARGTNARSDGRASSNALCGAGPNTSAVPSSRATLMNTAPASSAPRRRSTADAPSIWQRRR